MYGEPIIFKNVLVVSFSDKWMCSLFLCRFRRLLVTNSIHLSIPDSRNGAMITFTSRYLFFSPLLNYGVLDYHEMKFYVPISFLCSIEVKGEDLEEYFSMTSTTTIKTCSSDLPQVTLLNKYNQSCPFLYNISKIYDFVIECANSVVPAYLPIIEKRKDTPFTEKNKEWQQLRRGRYVEFNLVRFFCLKHCS